jgi:acetyltransferase-like isoleucine patch superfamily enzyme
MSDVQISGSSTFRGLPSRIVRAVLRRVAVHENVTFGQHFRVGRGAVISSPHGLVIGDWVSIGPHSTVQVDGNIGDFVLIGMYVQIAGRDDHAVEEVGVPYARSTWVADRPQTARDVVTIGRDVWIGGHSTVLSGVTIGEGSLIGSGSVVTRDVPPFSVAVGNPARVVSTRFTPEDQSAHSLGLDVLSKRLREVRKSNKSASDGVRLG